MSKISFFEGGGEMGALIRDIDWNKTLLGDPESWPQSLKLHIRTMLNNKVGMYIAWGPDHIQLYNDAFRPILGASKHPRAMGISSRETFAEIWETIGPMFKNVLKGEAVGFSDFMVQLERNGFREDCFFDFSYSPIFNEDDNVGGILVTVIETTARVNALKILNESANNLRNLVMTAPVSMCVFKGPEYIVEVVNGPMLALWGVAAETVLNHPIFEVLPEVKGQGLETLLDGVFHTGKTFTAKEHAVNLPRNGVLTQLYVNFTYEPFFNNQGKITGIIAVAVDVTEQVEARHKIEDLEERARLAIEIANIGTYDINLETDEIITSTSFDNIFGVNRKCTRDELKQIYHPDDMHIRDKAYQEAYENGYTSYQVRLKLSDGTIRWVKCEAKIYYNKSQKPIRLIGTVLDITHHIELQRQKDDFLAIASHELKTPLTSLKAYTQLLPALVRKGDEVTTLNLLKKTDRQIDKMTKLIHNFLDISKLESSQLQLQKEIFDLNDLISETINYYNLPENKERLRFKKEKIPLIYADKSKISHVVDNLLSNALKYSAQDKTVQVSSAFYDESIIVSVKDQGKGINESSKNKIFQRFYRAENVKNNTASGFGIGLYYASEIVRLHNGKIWFESIEGEGSTFYFSFPVGNN